MVVYNIIGLHNMYLCSLSFTIYIIILNNYTRIRKCILMSREDLEIYNSTDRTGGRYLEKNPPPNPQVFTLQFTHLEI